MYSRGNHRLLTALVIAASIFLFTGASFASSEEHRVAEQLGRMLIEQFQPEALDLTISNGGSFVYGEATGARIEGMRVDKIIVEAMLKAVPPEISLEKKYELADMIYYSKGTVVLLEKDVNHYFVSSFDDVKGFTKLKCDFSPNGFTASGTFTAKFIITLSVNLKATGVMALHRDGIYLENTKFFISGVKQPDALANQIVKEINPLLEFKEDIPFPVSIKTLKMTDDRIVATGGPKRSFEGENWRYRK